MNAKGIIHIHSKYSSDASLSIEELKNIFYNKGYNFIAVTDHLPKKDKREFSQKKYDLLVKECYENSNDEICVIPGLEIEVGEGFHILGIGVKELIGSSTAEIVIRNIKQQGGIAILAHPYRDHYRNINKDFFPLLNGIEIWNRNELFGSYPNTKVLKDLMNLRKNDVPVYGYISLDFHKIEDLKSGEIIINVFDLKQDLIMDQLRNGNFRLRVEKIEIGNDGKITKMSRLWYRINNSLYYGCRNSLKILQEKLEKVGIHIPKKFLDLGKFVFYRKRKIWSR